VRWNWLGRMVWFRDTPISQARRIARHYFPLGLSAVVGGTQASARNSQALVGGIPAEHNGVAFPRRVAVWHRRRPVRAGESLAESVGRARDRLNPTGVSRSRHCAERIASSRVLRSYLPYYHRTRTHLGLDKDAPDRRRSLRHSPDPSSPCLKSAGTPPLRATHRAAARCQSLNTSALAETVSVWARPCLCREGRRGRVERDCSM
jgi:hypothetical protein